jgi:predicted CxxxxCH...CXXCH cytochrome family protein
VRGETDTAAIGVGAHRAHVEDGALARAVACSECHVVPATVAGHLGDGPVVTFGELARNALPAGASPSWDRGTARCSGVYCHGATLPAGTNVAPVWTSVGTGEAACGACHGAPPPSHAPFGTLGCNVCHGDTVLPTGAIDVEGGRHVNGVLDVSLEGGGGVGCALCHGAPPPTGAHRIHASGVVPTDLAYGDLRVFEDLASPGQGYAFGCGHCHPLDPASHLSDEGGDGLPDVALGPPSPAVAGDELKSRNLAGAAWDGASGTCSGVTCHSSGQATPSFATTPPWTSAPGALRCDGCHANPPRHASGGAGAADANSHLQLQADGWEWGHLGGLPGPWHGSKHAVQPGITDAAPVTCQACHFESVDLAAGAGPSGFYWLDTTGDYRLPGGDPARLGSDAYARLDCTTCHQAGGPVPPALGRASPLRHVNGRRDVVFDPRTSLPDLAWLPAAPSRPTRPYWVTGSVTLPPGVDAIQEGATISMHLAGASYEPATKTCTNVACHLSQSSVAWGTPHAGFQACAACHGL